MLAIIDSEWGILIIVAAVVFLFGSTKLPQFARSLGLAKSEFHKGSAEGKKEATAEEETAKPSDQDASKT